MTPKSILLAGHPPHFETALLHGLRNSGEPPLIHISPDSRDVLDYLFGTGGYSRSGLADLLVIGSQMGTEGNPSVIEQIRTHERTKELPIVVIAPEGVVAPNGTGEKNFLWVNADPSDLSTKLKGLLGEYFPDGNAAS